MKKLTNVLALEMVLGMEEVKGNIELFAKIEGMKAQFEKKNKGTGDKKLTKVQEENLAIKDRILQVMASGEPVQVKDLQTKDGFQDYTNQKLSALVRQLVQSGEVERVEVKGKAFFKKVEKSVDTQEESMV